MTVPDKVSALTLVVALNIQDKQLASAVLQKVSSCAGEKSRQTGLRVQSTDLDFL